MRASRSRRRILLAMALVAGAAGVLADGGEEKPAEPPGAPVHRDPPALLAATLDAARAYLFEDAAAARAALDRVAAGTRKLDRTADAAFGHELLTYDQAFHMTLDRARELATAGQTDASFDQFVWVQRACRQCHRLSRERGLMPERASAP